MHQNVRLILSLPNTLQSASPHRSDYHPSPVSRPLSTFNSPMRPRLPTLLQTTAVSVATILGTGILGLPVTLHTSGLRPFFLTFTLNLIAQLGIVTATVELLQRAHEASPSRSNHAYNLLGTDDAPSSPLSASPAPPPSLHSLSEHFLYSRPLRLLFNLMVMGHFLFILVAYALAGPQALIALFPALTAPPEWLITVLYVVICAIAVIFFAQALLPTLTAGTLVKAALLTVLVFIVFVRGFAIRQHISTSWRPRVLIDPFLMGTFALNGVANLMPVTFQACLDSTKDCNGCPAPVDRHFVRAYRTATILAVVICYLLNILWAIAMLMCVPQTASVATNGDGMIEARTVVTTMVRGLRVLRETNASTSLQAANELGQISTIPLIAELRSRHDELDTVIVLLVNTFIALSITVSILVMSVGMKHYIDGAAQSQLQSSNSSFRYNVNRGSKYLLAYGFVLLCALGNPEGIFKIMEGVTGLSANIELGLILIYMLYVGRKMTKEIPAPLSPWHVASIIGYVTLYFSVAVVVDVIFFLPSSFT